MLSDTITPKDYIKGKIDEIVNKFPLLMCRYEQNELSRTHFIEVVPASSYNHDKTYLAFEEAIVYDFEDRYPYELISFITDSSLKKIDHVDYCKKGVCFEDKKEVEYLYSIGVIEDVPIGSYWTAVINTINVLEVNKFPHHGKVKFEDLDDGLYQRIKAIDPILEMALNIQGHCCNIAA